MSWAEDHFSDSIAIVIAYKEWKSAKTSGRFEFGGKVGDLSKVLHFQSMHTNISGREELVSEEHDQPISDQRGL